MKKIIILSAVVIAIVGCATTPSRDDLIRSKLESIVIPEIEFREASLGDVIAYLTAASAEIDAHDGISIAVCTPPPEKTKEVMDMQGEKQTVPDNSGDPVITYSGRNVRLLDAMRVVADAGNLDFYIKNGTVVFKKREVQQRRAW
jgi:hypothetical protein